MAMRWQLVGQASGFLQDKYKQARLALGDVTPAELLVQEATNNDACIPDARTLACIADAAYDMDDYWRIASVLRRRLARAADWKEWRPVYKSLVVLDFLLTHGPDELPRDFMTDTPSALRHLRGFTHVDDRGFDWGACMQRRCDNVLALLTDADRLRDARRRAVRVSHEVQHGCFTGGFSPRTSSSGSPSPSSASSSRTSGTSWSFASESPTTVCICGNGRGADYRHDKKFDAYTADDDWMKHLAIHSKTARVEEEDEDVVDDGNSNADEDVVDDGNRWDDLNLLPTPRSAGTVEGARPTRFCSRMFGAGSVSSRASGFQSLSQPERRAIGKKFHRQLSLEY